VVNTEDIPAHTPGDEVAASPATIQQMLDWTSLTFLGRPHPNGPERIALEVLRQDHSVLRFGRSCIETPITIGTRRFEHGLGTHANSEIRVQVAPGAKTFKAAVGIDNNYDTQGSRGSVVFSVEMLGKEVLRTSVLRGGEEPTDVSVDIPPGTEQIVLKTDATDDGPACDQADWADSHFVMHDGSIRRLDENQLDLIFAETKAPFSFLYNGAAAGELLPSWQKVARTEEDADRTIDTVIWTDPQTGLRVSAVVTTFRRYPAADWVLCFENTGDKDTPILENIQALDAILATGYIHLPAKLHQLEGDACGETSFLPKTFLLEPGKNFRLSPTGGRPSSISAFPFFNLEYEDQGVIVAVGWTGQWCAQLDRAPTGPTRLRAGLEKTHLTLHPGERIRTARIVVLPWQGDRIAAHNQWRRLLLDHYVPRLDGKPAALPVALQTFDRYNARPGWATEAGQIQAVETAHALGCDTYWLDAAWFPGNFPHGVGNWFCKPAEFPKGLKPVSDACHQYGMKFVLWFEPERVAPRTQIAEEHPEFVFGGKNGGLLKLNEPDARRFLTDLLSQRIREYGINIYRNDFNMDPLDFWRQNDAPDRIGMTETQYVEGLYAMWDELRGRHPGLLIDNCSSGGRRIDIEMCSRSVPLWRSDTNCSAGHPDWNQAQTAGISLYVPLHTACTWTPASYETRSAATGGLLCELDYLDPGFPREQAATWIAEAKANQPFWYGDFYPLTPCGTARDQFVAYQFHRADLNAGLALAFRRTECEYLGLVLGLRGIELERNYLVEFVDSDGRTSSQTMKGEALATDLTLRVPDKGGSLLVRYRRQ
jgi:alpha-galactosidase